MKNTKSKRITKRKSKEMNDRVKTKNGVLVIGTQGKSQGWPGTTLENLLNNGLKYFVLSSVKKLRHFEFDCSDNTNEVCFKDSQEKKMKFRLFVNKSQRKVIL